MPKLQKKEEYMQKGIVIFSLLVMAGLLVYGMLAPQACPPVNREAAQRLVVEFEQARVANQHLRAYTLAQEMEKVFVCTKIRLADYNLQGLRTLASGGRVDQTFMATYRREYVGLRERGLTAADVLK